ncbi:MAG: phosphopyruvate hydratase [Clostridia bacterium]|nr:phosphopyruvate hydratase [Clostridia bacterium]
MVSSKHNIMNITAREILDSRANPTLEATVMLEDGSWGTAAVPSGASVGRYEAREMRDGHMERYFGKGVHGAARIVKEVIAPALIGKSAMMQGAVDHAMIDLDGTKTKEKLGANSTLAVSLATARAMAASLNIPLYRYLGGAQARRLPVPMLNIINGGAHAKNNVEIQEFMIVPSGYTAFTEGVRAAVEVYHTLGKILEKRGYATTLGDEGGFAPDLRCDEEALELITEAIVASGHNTDDIEIALDVASSGWYRDGRYTMPKNSRATSSEHLIEYYERLVTDYPIISIEDGLSEDDAEGFAELTRRLGNRIMTVGDDLFVTNRERLNRGIRERWANSILIKPNQIGTLTETLSVIDIAKRAGYNYIISHRSGETEDTFIADLAAATNAPYIKTGAPARAERTAKYNRLMQIEAWLGCSSMYGNKE